MASGNMNAADTAIAAGGSIVADLVALKGHINSAVAAYRVAVPNGDMQTFMNRLALNFANQGMGNYAPSGSDISGGGGT